MTHTLFTLVLILAVVLCPDSAHAQENAKEAALREKAFKLLESAAGQIANLQSPENRARLGANIADSLWNHDEKRARALFALVEEDIRAGMANRNLKDPKDRHTLKVFLKLRLDTVERIAKHDAELNELPTNAARVQLLLDYVHTRVSNNRNTLLKVLKQASEIADAMKPGKEQTDAQLKLALIYCLEKNDRGFAIMESLVPKLNDLVEAAVKLDGFETSYLRDGEWNMSANGNVGEMLTTLSRYAGYFAWCDFDRAASLAAQFDRSEIRLMAQVKLAQAILAGPPKRMRTNRHYVFGR